MNNRRSTGIAEESTGCSTNITDYVSAIVLKFLKQDSPIVKLEIVFLFLKIALTRYVWISDSNWPFPSFCTAYSWLKMDEDPILKGGFEIHRSLSAGKYKYMIQEITAVRELCLSDKWNW